ncbi:polyprenyl synthetase family protein [Weissella paramesenteroides]|uniref:polyprenyl synthetase family protein n=1 Tax=Weissella paramesenteroides TaxID=1249 RepID=UPI003F2120CB
MQFKEFSTNIVPQIEHTLENELAKSASVAELQEAMRYAVMAGGKRLRPMLSLAVIQTYGLPVNEYLKVASAIELIHTYSLIHDDLPAMDDDELRRGKPTTHRAFGEDTAILAGDALQPLTFEWLTDLDQPLNDAQRVQLVIAMAQAAGGAGMVAGQVLDIEAMKTSAVTLAETQAIHYHKTGALIAYALQAGAIMANANEDIQNILHDFGMAYGLAFQIKDDIDDYQAGKIESQAYPTILGLSETVVALQKQVDLAQSLLLKFEDITGLDKTLLASFLDYFTETLEQTWE